MTAAVRSPPYGDIDQNGRKRNGVGSLTSFKNPSYGQTHIHGSLGWSRSIWGDASVGSGLDMDTSWDDANTKEKRLDDNAQATPSASAAVKVLSAARPAISRLDSDPWARTSSQWPLVDTSSTRLSSVRPPALTDARHPGTKPLTSRLPPLPAQSYDRYSPYPFEQHVPGTRTEGRDNGGIAAHTSFIQRMNNGSEHRPGSTRAFEIVNSHEELSLPQVTSWANQNVTESSIDEQLSSYGTDHAGVSSTVPFRNKTLPCIDYRQPQEEWLGDVVQEFWVLNDDGNPSFAHFDKSSCFVPSSRSPAELASKLGQVHASNGLECPHSRPNLAAMETSAPRQGNTSHDLLAKAAHSHGHFSPSNEDLHMPLYGGHRTYFPRAFADQIDTFRLPSASQNIRAPNRFDPRRGSDCEMSSRMKPYTSYEYSIVPSRSEQFVNNTLHHTDPRFSYTIRDHEQLMRRHMYHQMMRGACLSSTSYRFPDFQLGGYHPYMHVPPTMLPPRVPAALLSAASRSENSVRSTLLEEFRANVKGSRRYELREIYDHIVEFAGDQHGSRFIQQKLETANSDEKEQMYRELSRDAIPLMKDVFGNYVIQKFFEHGDQNQKKALAGKMKGQVLDLTLQIYGCRVVQKALEHILVDQQASLIKELEHHVLRCVKDQHGNHVIQKAIERMPPEYVRFIIDALTGHVYHLATHLYGCRVVQRILERYDQPGKQSVLQELHACATTLISDQYGNYVTGHVIEHGSLEDRAKIFSLIQEHLVAFSTQKSASHVVEKSMEFGTDAQRREMMMLFSVKDEKGETALPMLIKHSFGNYVIQRLLDTLSDPDYAIFVEILKPEIINARRLTINHKQAENVGKKMHRLDRIDPSYMYHHHIQNHPSSIRRLHIDPSIMPTPALMTDDAQSSYSSSLPSTVGDSVPQHLESVNSHACFKALDIRIEITES